MLGAVAPGEQLAGYYLLDCENLDEAIEWARNLFQPAAPLGIAAFEIRPLQDHSQIAPACDDSSLYLNYGIPFFRQFNSVRAEIGFENLDANEHQTK